MYLPYHAGMYSVLYIDCIFVPTLPPLPIYSPLCFNLVFFTYSPIPTLLCLYNYLVSCALLLQQTAVLFSNLHITARHVQATIKVVLILKGNLLTSCTKNAVCMATYWNA